MKIVHKLKVIGMIRFITFWVHSRLKNFAHRIYLKVIKQGSIAKAEGERPKARGDTSTLVEPMLIVSRYNEYR